MESMPRLRPMSIGDMLDAAFRLYRRHFLTFIGIVALLQVPMAILQFAAQLPYMQALQRFTARPPGLRRGPARSISFPFAQLLPYYALIFGLGIFQYLLVYNLMTGALANAISRSYLGQPISILSSYNIGFKRFIALIAASLMPFAISLAFVAIIAGCAFGAFYTLRRTHQRAAKHRASDRGGDRPDRRDRSRRLRRAVFLCAPAAHNPGDRAGGPGAVGGPGAQLAAGRPGVLAQPGHFPAGVRLYLHRLAGCSSCR